MLELDWRKGHSPLKGDYMAWFNTAYQCLNCYIQCIARIQLHTQEHALTHIGTQGCTRARTFTHT